MEHIAILSKKRNLLAKILSGEKTIESRWHFSRRAPWNLIKPGEIIYFKESGEPVSAKAEVEKVLQFELTPDKVREIIYEHGKEIGICTDGIPSFLERNLNKKHCILVFLKNVSKIAQFSIDKRGFGLMSAWICVESVDALKKAIASLATGHPRVRGIYPKS